MSRGRGGGQTPEPLRALLKEAVRRSSQSEVARASGLGVASVNRYLQGVGEPSRPTLEKLADHFSVPVSWLSGDLHTDTVHLPEDPDFYRSLLHSVEAVGRHVRDDFEVFCASSRLVYQALKLIHKFERTVLLARGQFPPEHLEKVEAGLAELTERLDARFFAENSE